MASVGIPRALFFYEYYPLWKKFFEELGAEIVVSSKTNKLILDNGIKACVDEACLPIKIFFGHVIDLKDRVDYIFVPRLISVSKMESICPKIGGLPDMIRHSGLGLPPIIDMDINLRKSEKDIYTSIIGVGNYFTTNNKLIYRAYNNALQQYKRYKQMAKLGTLPSEMFGVEDDAFPLYLINKRMRQRLSTCVEKCGLNIAIIGHAYNVYDSYVNMGLIDKLEKKDVNIITIEMLQDEDINSKANTLRKKMFWRFGRKAIGSSLHLVERCDIDGIIFLMSFACGVDSFVCDLAERYIRRKSKIPFLVLTIDEHTGEAGINTRIEAFIDMITWRNTNEGNFSAYGEPIYNS